MGSRRTITAAAAVIATSAGLYPVFSGGTWFWAGAGAVGCVAAAGALTRLRRLPVPACLLGGLAVLLLYLNAAFARSLLPTPSSLGRLWTLAAQGLGDAPRYAPPAPELPGLMLLAAAGIGLVGLLADLIAVRLGNAALAGPPLLVLFTAPFTLSVSRGLLGTTAVFCLAAAGYLTLLGVEGRERVREWARVAGVAGVAPDRRNRDPTGRSPGVAPRRPDTGALAAAGRRVGLASILVALCVPLLVPGLHSARLFGGGAPAVPGGSGGGAVGFPDPRSPVSAGMLSGSAVPVLSYTSTAAQPDYLQLYVLGDLTARGWGSDYLRPRGLPSDASLPAPPGLVLGAGGPDGAGGTGEATAQAVTTRVSISGRLNPDTYPALPVPYAPVRVNAAGTVLADPGTGMVFDAGAQLPGLRYSVTSLDVTPDARALAAASPPPAAITGEYLQVPSSYTALRRLARAITATGATPYAKAVALQDWLADGNFTYSLSAPSVTDAASLENFVDSTRSGYCQQFAFAMAVLARLAGIPSRVAYGFTQGTRRADGSWLVTTHDAHAWPELYFQGAGWLRFEPTPAGTGGQGTATDPAYAAPRTAPSRPSPSASQPNPAGTAGAVTGNQPAPRPRQLPGGGGGGGGAPPPPSGGPDPWLLAGVSLAGLLAVLAGVLPGCARAAIRRRRWRRAALPPAPAHPGGHPPEPPDAALADAAGTDAALADAAWRELRDDLRDYHADGAASESPRALARRVTDERKLPADAAAALGRVALAAERARYSARPAGGAALRADTATVRRALASSAPRHRRWLARMFPPSVLIPRGLRERQALSRRPPGVCASARPSAP